MERKNNIIVLLLFVLLGSCSGSGLSPVDYMRWVENEDNNCIQKKTISDIDYIAIYKPTDYVTLKELSRSSGEEGINEQAFTDMKNEFKDMEYYTIKMGTPASGRDILLYNIGSEQEYYERVNYYTVNAQDDIYLVKGNDTLPCELFHYERTYGVSPYNNILLGFATAEKDHEPEPTRLHFNDRVFNSGLLIFSFSKSGIPTLKIN